MRKFIDPKTKCVYSLGDDITICETVETRYSVYNSSMTFELTEILAEELVKEGKLEEVKEKKSPDYDLKKILVKSLENLGVKDAFKTMACVAEIAPGAMTSLLLRLCAIEADKKYKDHIFKADTLYYVNNPDREIKIWKGLRKKSDLLRVAFFRDKTDAIIALLKIEKVYNEMIDVLMEATSSLKDEQKD